MEKLVMEDQDGRVRPRRVESENAEEILKDDASVDASTENASRPAKKCTVCWCERHSGELKGWGFQGGCRTCGRIGRKSAECRWRVACVEEEDDDCRRDGGQLESEEDGEVGGVWNRWECGGTRGS